MRIVLAAALAALVVGCPLSDRQTPVEPDYPPPPPWMADVPAGCSSACSNLRTLDCPEGKGSMSGETCERVCIRANELRPLPLACWAAATTVAAAKGCGSLRCVR